MSLKSKSVLLELSDADRCSELDEPCMDKASLTCELFQNKVKAEEWQFKQVQRTMQNVDQGVEETVPLDQFLSEAR